MIMREDFEVERAPVPAHLAFNSSPSKLLFESDVFFCASFHRGGSPAIVAGDVSDYPELWKTRYVERELR